MLIAGIAGGLTNFFHTRPKEEGENPWYGLFVEFHLWKCIVSGIVASFVVPLFLVTTKSDLLNQIEASASSFSSDHLVLAGFCLLAAFSSRAFLDSLAKKALLLAEESKETSQANQKQIEVLEEVSGVESDDEETIASPKNLTTTLSSNESTVMKALLDPRWTFRSLSGLVKDSGLTNEQVRKTLDGLVRRRFANTSVRKIGCRWYATALGRSLFEDAGGAGTLKSEPPEDS